VLGLRVRTVVVLVLVALVALTAAAWFSPLLAVRSVAVRGATVVGEQQVVDALEVPAGTPLLRVDLTAAATRVAALPRVATAKVERVLPSTLRVSVLERRAVAFVSAAGGAHLIDAGGVDFAVEAPPPGLPELVVTAPAPGDPRTTTALGVLGALPDALRTQVGKIGARSTDGVELTLRDGRTVRWGGADSPDRKAAVLAALLTRPGRVFDVSSPALPTVQ